MEKSNKTYFGIRTLLQYVDRKMHSPRARQFLGLPGIGLPNIPDYCGWSIENENSRGQRASGVEVRKYPFPYRCAVSINNDTDGFRYPAFEAFHAYVNGSEETPFGPGLGLEIADSFWVWASGGEFGLYHSKPWSKDITPSPEHDRILELAKSGWLDTMHGFGAWNDDRFIERDQMSYALDYLDSKGVKLKVYVGHGGHNMAHNFGGPWGYYQNADNPEHPSYCFDILTDYGFKYYWTDVCYELDKFGDDLLFESQEQLDSAVSGHDFNRYFYANDPADYTRAREVFPNADERELVEWRQKLFNHTIASVMARDGNPALIFKRFRGHDGPMAGNFIAQVNPESLDELEKRGGAAIVYQHFGVWRAMFTGKRHASQRSSEPENVLDEHNIWAFRTLAERFHEGRILVATTRRLLDFLWMRNHLEYRVEQEGDQITIRIDAINCPAVGRINPDVTALAGVAFELPKTFGEPIVLAGDIKLPVKIAEDPENQDRLIAYLPWQVLEYPG